MSMQRLVPRIHTNLRSHSELLLRSYIVCTYKSAALVGNKPFLTKTFLSSHKFFFSPQTRTPKAKKKTYRRDKHEQPWLFPHDDDQASSQGRHHHRHQYRLTMTDQMMFTNFLHRFCVKEFSGGYGKTTNKLQQRMPGRDLWGMSKTKCCFLIKHHSTSQHCLMVVKVTIVTLNPASATFPN